MAVTKTLTGAIPYVKSNKVEKWNFVMKYNQGNKSANPPTYYESSFTASIPAVERDGTVNFTPKAESSWTLAELKALCPTAEWDPIFARQYDTVITNPPNKPLPDNDYVIPS